MAVVQSGLDSTLATVDTTTKALHVLPKGVGTVTLNTADFVLDSFQRLRVSDARIAFEYAFGALTPTLATTIWEATAYGAGTEALTTNLNGVELNTTTATTTGRWIQSINHVRYAPGISTLMRFTFNFNELITNVIQRVGMFTDQGTFPSTAGDGLFLEANGSAIALVRRYMTAGAGGAEERILQASWNLDKLNGTGASGVTLNWALTQHLVIEYQFLGVGTIRFGFETSAGVVWAHEIISVNSLSTSWARTGSLPVRAEVYSTGALAQAGKLTLYNVVVIQEGDVADLRGWRYFGGTSGTTAKVGGTAAGLFPVLSLRAASTNDLTKRARIIPVGFTVVVAVPATGATSLQVALLLNPTPNTGATFAVTTAGSVATIDIAATATTAVTGSAMYTAVIPNVAGVYNFELSTLNDNANVIGYNAAGTVAITGSSVLCLAVGTLTGTTTVAATVSASINWKEIV